MGLFSAVKRVYYNNKLQSADKDVVIGNYIEAEIAYEELIPNHPEAVTQLAKMIFDQASNKNDSLEFYKKALDCRLKLVNGVSNIESYNNIQDQVAKKIYDVFIKLKNEKQYEKAMSYILVLLHHINDSKNIQAYHQCQLDYAKFLIDTDLEMSFKLIDLFHSDALTRPIPKDSIPKALCDTYQFQLKYARSLRITHSEKSDKIIEKVYINLKLKSLPKDIVHETANEIFIYAKEYADSGNFDKSSYLCDLILNDNYKAKILFIENSIKIITNEKNSRKENPQLLGIINSVEDKNITANYFGQLLGKVPDSQEEYVKVILELVDWQIFNLHYDKAIFLLNDANVKKEDSRFYDKLIAVVHKYIANSDYKSAVITLDRLIDKHPNAQPLLARCYLKQSEATSSVDEKYKLLIKGLNFAQTHSKLFNASLYLEYHQAIIIKLFDVTIKYAEYGYYSDAYKLLDMLFSISPDTIDTYIKIRLIEANDKSNLEKKITLLKETIVYSKLKLKNAVSGKEQLLEKVYIDLINSTIKKVANSDLDLVINELSALNQDIGKEKLFTKEFQVSYKDLKTTLANSYYQKGVRFETELDIIEAIKYFDVIINQFHDVQPFASLALGRKCICYFKKQETYNIKTIIDTIHAYLSEQKKDKIVLDLAYRYVIYLLKDGNFSVAEPIIDEFLSTKAQSGKLKQICTNEKVKYGLKFLEEYNQNILSIENDSLPLTEALKLFSEFDEIEERISSIFSDTKEAIVKNKSKVQNYILKKYFDEEKYWECLSFIKENFKNYYKDERLFHNAAIAALGVATIGQLNSTNFKKTISIWLTAIYSDILFVRSLDKTEWDDNYSFSLVDSLGNLNEKDIKKLPGNINFDDSDETNISIGDVQRSLLAQFEKALTDNQYSDNFITKALEFYESEKDAISALSSLNLDHGCFACTPFFSENKKDVHKSIANALDKKFDNLYFYSTDDTLLKVGLLFKIEGDRYKQYSEAKILMAKGVEVATKMQTSQIKLIFSSTNINKIKQFDELFRTFCNEIKDCLALRIKKEDEYEIIIPNYLIICSLLSDANLNFMLSNFANQVCVSRLNDDSMLKSKGLDILSSIFSIINDNVRLNKNLQSILNSAILEVIIEGDLVLRNTLYDILSKHARHFEKDVVETLEENIQVFIFSGKLNALLSFIDFFSPKSIYKSKLNNLKTSATGFQVDFDLHELVEKLNAGKITTLQGLQQTFDLYKLHKEHQRLCDNLVILCGNAIQGEIMAATYKAPQICTILDNICINRSATFKLSATKLKMERQSILNSLPSDFKNHIEFGTPIYGELSSNGIALKKGLSYLKRLSD